MRALGLVAVFCVLSIFFFPSHQGPYSVIHGPVTALRALLLATRLLCVLALLVLNPLLVELLYFSIPGRLSGSKSALGRNGLVFRIAPVLPAVFRC